MNNQTAYWLWIQQAIGFGSQKISHILDNFTFAEDFYRASLNEKLTCGCFNQKDIYKLKDTSLQKARQIIDCCKEQEIEIITIGDVAYPERLMEITSPPAVLFVKGNKEVLSDNISIAMVGTRTATPYGMRNAFKFAYDLAKKNVTVISGGALGIDTYSHRGALQADGKTVCVLGCGISYKYLSENDEMKKQILRKGAVISEYPPYTRASRYTFPQRNRIISGLSNGVLVIEAGRKSGSIITANFALDQHRDVFAVPGDISSDVSFGTNQLIKDGAVAVTSAEDIIGFYSGNVKTRRKTKRRTVPEEDKTFVQLDLIFDYNNSKNIPPEKSPAEDFYIPVPKKKYPEPTVKKSTAAKTKPEPKLAAAEEQEVKTESENTLKKIPEGEFNELSENLQKILLAFGTDVMHVDSLAEKSGLPINIVHSALTQLEMYDYIEPLEGRNYKILVSVK